MHINNLGNAIRSKLIKAEKPELSLKDWTDILHYINTLEAIIKVMNEEEYPEYFDMRVREIMEKVR